MLVIRVLCAFFKRIWHSLVTNELNVKCDVRSTHRLGEYTEQAHAGGTLPLAYFPQQVIVSTSGMNQHQQVDKGFTEVVQLIAQARQRAVQAVNTTLIELY